MSRTATPVRIVLIAACVWIFDTFLIQVCQNELQRKKNEADLLREKVGKLETDIQGMKHDLAMAKEQRLQHSLQCEVHAQTQALERLIQGSDSPALGQAEESSGHVSTESLQRDVEGLKQQLREEKEAQERLANSFEQERQTWNKEKGRVIKYQKQLQINYLQMHKKNQDLERILKELTAEMESRTELGMDINYGSGLQTYEDVIATEIWPERSHTFSEVTANRTLDCLFTTDIYCTWRSVTAN